MEARAFAPGHVTCFFTVHNDADVAPARRGSRGVGFSVESGVEAHARALGPPRPARGGLPFELAVWDNGSPVEDPRTTRATLEALVALGGDRGPVPGRLELRNAYTLPLGAGFGVSGACALSAALAANEALGLHVPFSRCVEAAHVGEVSASSGLGDVVAQATGGFEVRLGPGAPPHGRIRALGAPSDPLLLVTFGPLRTKAFLGAPERVAAANEAGGQALAKFLEDPTLDQAIARGLEFAQRLGLVSPAARAILESLPGNCAGTVAMLGDSLVVARPPPGLGAAARQAHATFVEATHVAAHGARLLPSAQAPPPPDQE
jgi:pantoate kinase